MWMKRRGRRGKAKNVLFHWHDRRHRCVGVLWYFRACEIPFRWSIDRFFQPTIRWNNINILRPRSQKSCGNRNSLHLQSTPWHFRAFFSARAQPTAFVRLFLRCLFLHSCCRFSSLWEYLQSKCVLRQKRNVKGEKRLNLDTKCGKTRKCVIECGEIKSTDFHIAKPQLSIYQSSDIDDSRKWERVREKHVIFFDFIPFLILKSFWNTEGQWHFWLCDVKFSAWNSLFASTSKMRNCRQHTLASRLCFSMGAI